MPTSVNSLLVNNVKYHSVRDIIRCLDGEETDEFYRKVIFFILPKLDTFYNGVSRNIIDVLYISSQTSMIFTYNSGKKADVELIKILTEI